MKYRSSRPPTASASARRTSRHAPLTQSGYCRRRVSASTRGARARVASAAARSAGRSSARTTARRGRGRRRAAVRRPRRPGRASSSATADRSRRQGRPCRCSAAAASAPRAGADADVVRAREPEVAVGSRSPATSRPAPRGLGAAVGRSRCRRRRSRAAAAGGAACSDSRQRSRSARALNDTMMIETSRSRHAAALRAPPASRAPRAASCISPAPRGAAARIRCRAASSNSSDSSAARDRREVVDRDVERRVAAALARHRRVEQHRRHAGRQRLERRQAEPFVLRQKRKGARVGVQRRAAARR